MRKAKIRNIYKDYRLLRKEIEKNISKLGLSLEAEFELFVRLDEMKKILDKLDKLCCDKTKNQ